MVLGGGCVLGNQCPERQSIEDLEAALARSAAISECLGFELDRDVGPDPRELTALPRRLDVGEQRFAIALLGISAA